MCGGRSGGAAAGMRMSYKGNLCLFQEINQKSPVLPKQVHTHEQTFSS